MTETQPKQAPSVAKEKVDASADLPSSNPPRQDALPADAVADDPGGAALQKVVRDTVDEETAQGFRGSSGDPTPRKNYTVEGVGAGLPTPETIVRQEK